MSDRPKGQVQQRDEVWRDLIFIFVAAILISIAGAFFDVFARFGEWLHRNPAFGLHVEEAIALFVFLTFALGIFSLRRWSQLKKEIARREQAQSQHENERLLLKVLIEQLPAGVLLSDIQGHFVQINERASDILGIELGELIGLTTEEIYKNVHATKPDGKPLAAEEIPSSVAARSQGPVSLIQLLITTPAGEARQLAVTAAPLIFKDKGLFGSVVVINDLTEQFSLQEQLRQAQKVEAIGTLAGGIAHDFNNLLTAIIGYSDLTIRKLEESDPLRSNIEEIMKAAARAASLTRQLLAFGRKQILQPKILDINEVVADTSKMLRRLIGEDIELITVLHSSLGQVKADPSQIDQIILNLAVNARDALPHGGKLIIETANVELDDAYARRHIGVQPGRYVMLAVSDNGTGMSPEIQRHIFEPFYTTKAVDKGTGLGLSTVYGVVKQSGGNIWVYSEVGKGTTFKIYLPRIERAVELKVAIADSSDAPRGTETILLVEDEELVRNLARTILEERGYRILEARDGQEALSICEQHADPIHLLLTDMVMPQMSGHELCKRCQPLRPGMRVLFVSGYTDAGIVHHGGLDDDVAFLQKPFTPDTLLCKVRDVLDAIEMDTSS